MSLQVCHCGWSKVTTYHGLRIHQGKMGCTQRGVEAKESEQQQYMWEHVGLTNNQKDFGLDVYTPNKTDYYSDLGLQECHCGWSKVTTYHGLRTHQGKMGCTPKGMRIPKIEPWNWNNQWEEVDQMKHQPAKKVTLKKEISDRGEMTRNWNNDSYRHSTTKSKPPIAIPHRSSQIASKSGWQQQDFSTGVQVNRSVREHPTIAPWETVVRPKEKDRKDQTPSQVKELHRMFSATAAQETAVRPKGNHREETKLSQVRPNRIPADAAVKHKSQMREQKVSQGRSSAKARQPFQGSSEAEWLEIRGVFSEVVRVAEDAKQKSLDLSVSTLRTTTSTMMEQIHQKLEKLTAIELKWISKFAVDVELDPTTAHRCLVYAYGKKVSNRGENQETPGKFGSVLGLNRLTSGKSYWEVVVSNNTGWTLGVAKGNANHKGKLSLNPDNGYWVTEHYKNEYAALTATPIRLSLKEKPQKVGVFVDYEEGLVSFYNVTAQSHIYSFTECLFTGEIYPYFTLYNKGDGEMNGHLIISTVKPQ